MNNQPISFINWRNVAGRHPSAFLLAAQLISLGLYAALEGVSGGRYLLGIFGMMVLLLVVWVVVRSPATTWIAWLIAAPAAILNVWSWLSVSSSLLLWASVLEAMLYFYAAGSLIAYMTEDREVTADELFAAGATFTLIAWGFAYVYLACQIALPGSIEVGVHPGQPLTFVELLFFSFTNLSATGLGDILPVMPTSRVLVMLEQFAGVAYIAVVVSRLIGLTIVRFK